MLGVGCSVRQRPIRLIGLIRPIPTPNTQHPTPYPCGKREEAAQLRKGDVSGAEVDGQHLAAEALWDGRQAPVRH